MTYKYSEVRKKFEEWGDAQLEPRTMREYRRYFDEFGEQIGDPPVDELQAVQLLTFGTNWHRVQAIQRLFNWAVDADLITHSPFRKVKRPEKGQRQRIFGRRELLRMLRLASPSFRALLIAQGELICRPQEVRNLRWELIRYRGDSREWLKLLVSGQAEFVLWEYKSRKFRKEKHQPRVIPISRRLGRLLARVGTRTTRRFGEIFKNDKGRAWTKDEFVRQMSKLRDRAGIWPDYNGENVVAYTLRHTFATRAVANGVPLPLVKELLGHSSIKTTERYIHLQTEHLHEAMDVAHKKTPKKKPA